MVEMSKEIEEYFALIQSQVDHCYSIAEEARSKGLDPEEYVECPQAKDLAGRVEKLVGPEGIAEVIRKLKTNGLKDDEIVFKVVTDILDKRIGSIESLGERVERAIRAGLAIKTMGVVSAPLEGISKILVRTDQSGKKYLSLFFAGPIRAAGGTTAALCVLIADFVRKKSNIPKYEATEAEIGRYVEEVKLYDRNVHLQYPSSNREIRYAVKNLPIEINGDSTEVEEVSAFRDLPRIETNNIRGGACLVLNDGILLKAPKLLKIAKAMNLDGWDWLDDLKKIAQKEESEKSQIQNEKKEQEKISPNFKYVADIIAGRPVFSHPSEIGGHRIRYGRSRNTGLAAGGIHPATMGILDDFIAIGTQLRIERPGKSTSVCPVSAIEPPIVKLKNKNVVRVTSYKMAKNVFQEIEEVLFLGDILFGFGEFTENNHKLIPSGYVEEWWALDLETAVKDQKNISSRILTLIKNPFSHKPKAIEAIKISREYQIPLHPSFTDFWGNISIEELYSLRNAFLKGFSNIEKKIVLSLDDSIKTILEKAFIIHNVNENKIFFPKRMNVIYSEIFNLENKNKMEFGENDDVFSYFRKISSIVIRNKAPYFMGSRMGRPEKSERKSMKGVHALFPLSDKVGSSRSVEKALELQKVKIDVCRKKCPNCGTISIFNICPKCSTHTSLGSICEKCKKLYPPSEPNNDERCPQCNGRLKASSEAIFNLKNHINLILRSLQIPFPKKLKGIYGLTNQFKVPEPLEKGILRAKNNVLVYKTAEIRYDATDIPLTHFKPIEIETSITQLKELGYSHDYKHDFLTDENQIVELMVQDIILSDDCAKYFIKIANFLDDELEYFYKMNRFYNINKREDLIGHLVVGLAPHTSAGIIGRIIGFSPARSIYAHPYWHSAKRRNCFPDNTRVLVEINGQVRKISFKKLYNDHFKNEYFDKMAFVKEQPINKIKVYSFDKNSGNILKTDIKNVVKIPYSNRLIKFNLITGRSFQTTLDHPVIVFSQGKIIEKRAVDVLATDKFILPSISFEIDDIDNFDLIKEFYKDGFKDIWSQLMIRGIRDFTKNLIEKIGLKNTAERIKINKKTLNNYYGKRDSIPLDILVKLLEMNNLSVNDLPDCRIGFKGDHTAINRFIEVNESLMKLFGYYIAEGFYRKTLRGYQVDFAVSEEDLRKDMINSIHQSFGNCFNPYINESRITISNRVIYHFFKDILKFRNKARLKHIPAFLFKFPKQKLKYLLAAYFSGDGGLDICRKTVNCSSSSLRLIQDLDLLLLKFKIFSGLSQFSRNDSIEYKLRIRGVNVFKYRDEIGFISNRKAKTLENILDVKNVRQEPMHQKNRLIGIKNVEIIPSNKKFVYSLNADKYHTVLINDNIITHQCDGDEDGIMLLLDPLLNFSRHYLPNKIGGRMDATLVISSLLDPNEVESEAHNVDIMSCYPLAFYEATEIYAMPSEIENVIDLVKHRLGTPKQFIDLGYNIPTENINEGPKTTAYKLYESMDEKIDAQLHLAKIIKAVDARKVAEKILSTHFNPDILGNLRKFSVQNFRCVKCNSKYRRPPLSSMGKCIKCGNKIILTVNRGGIEKYIPRAIKLCKNFNLDNYTIQRMELIEEYVESLTNNPKIKQHKLVDFF
ncbi:MAG: DNA-directed DNA polymerase II large subunit [Promethearchaeota archaeon]